jgi:type I restriction enzyme R subunit
MQVSKTNEAALESHIEKALLADKYATSLPADFNAEFAIDTKKLWEFLEATQKNELDKLRGRPDWQRLILERLDRKIKKMELSLFLKKALQLMMLT